VAVFGHAVDPAALFRNHLFGACKWRIAWARWSCSVAIAAISSLAPAAGRFG